MFLSIRFENVTQHNETVQTRLQKDTDPPEASQGACTATRFDANGFKVFSYILQ